MNNSKYYYLYLLELTDDSYYIGITALSDPYIRIIQHFEGNGSKWTKIHRPIKVLSLQNIGELTILEARDKEQLATKKFMNIFGYDKVRGGNLTFSGDYVKFKNRYLQACR